MTDVRDPAPLVDLKPAEDTGRGTLVSRALAPIRRVTGLRVPTGTSALVPHVEPRSAVDVGKKSYAGIIGWSFVIVVLVPMLISGVYFFLWASDQYVAEARFAVRQADPISGMQTDEKGGGGSAGGGSLGVSVDLKSQDAEVVASYIKSRAIVDDVSRKLDLRAIFRRPEADIVARMPANVSMEDLTNYWDRMISVYVEGTSGIVTVSASAFRREDSLALAQAILASSETLINSLSLKMRSDTTRLAEDEVRRSEGEVRFALANLQSFRNSEHLIDPLAVATTTSKLLLELMSARIEAEGQIYIATHSQGPNAPGMKALHAKLDIVNGQIKTLKDQLAGNPEEAKNMAATLSEFEELELKEKFAEKMYTFAQNGVERARMAGMRQTVYLAIFVPPYLPEEYAYPLRFTDFMLISMGAFMVWICGVTISASVLDHRI